MIPAFNISGVLPPFDPASYPANPNAMAPYRTSMLELAQRFGTSAERISMINGLISYRSELRSIGIVDGFQWIDGSFVEDVERIKLRPPGDVDVTTFATRPTTVINDADWRDLIVSNLNMFDPGIIKSRHKCEAFFVDLTMSPVDLVNDSKYWFGLFSHQRSTFLWKGMLELSLNDNDMAASQFLAQGGTHAP